MKVQRQSFFMRLFWVGCLLMAFWQCRSTNPTAGESASLPADAPQNQTAVGAIPSGTKVSGAQLILTNLELKTLQLKDNSYPYVMIAQPPKSDFFQSKICTDSVCQDPQETTQPFVFLPGLPPGTYTFEVRACVQPLHAADPAQPCGPWVAQGPYTQVPILDAELDGLLVQQANSLQRLASYGNAMYQLVQSYDQSLSHCPVSADQRPSSLDEVDIQNALAIGPDAFSYLMYPLDQTVPYSQFDTSVPFSMPDYNSLSYLKKKMAGQIFQDKKYKFNSSKQLVDSQGARLDYYDFLKELTAALDTTYITYSIYLALDPKEKKALSLIIGEKKYQFDDEVLVDAQSNPVSKEATMAAVKERAKTISDEAVAPPSVSTKTISLPALIGSIAGFFISASVLKKGFSISGKASKAVLTATDKIQGLQTEALKNPGPKANRSQISQLETTRIDNAKAEKISSSRKATMGKGLAALGGAMIVASVITAAFAGAGILTLADTENTNCPELAALPAKLEDLKNKIQKETQQMDALSKTISSSLQ
jgi:hypothetical protein